MIKSMTGYGKGEAHASQGRCTVEIRAVNHRYGEISVKMPRSFLAFEQDVKKCVAQLLKRGKIDVFVQWEEAVDADTLLQIDTPLAQRYAELFRTLADDVGIAQEVPLSLLVAQKGVVRDSGGVLQADEDVEESWTLLMEALQKGVAAIDAMRCREGEALRQDLMQRRTQVAQWVDSISRRAPMVVSEYRQKLTARLDQLLDGADIDPARLAQEVALMADRCDVTEELVRLSSHFTQFDETLALDEPVGRKLDFMMQELNREVNTIGSKSSDAEVTSLVIRIKAEMEKMREQVQNIE